MQFKPIVKALDNVKKIKNKDLSHLVEEELEILRKAESDILAYVDSKGFTFYQLKESKILLWLPHNGRWTPANIEFDRSEDEQHTREEDLYTTELYLPIFLEKGGLLFSTQISRYYVDLNRKEEHAVLCCDPVEGKKLNFTEPDEKTQELINEGICHYRYVYEALDKCMNSYAKRLELAPSEIYFIQGHSMLPEKEDDKREEFRLCVFERTNGELLQEYLKEQKFLDIKIMEPNDNPWGFNVGEGIGRFPRDLYEADTIFIEIRRDLFLNKNRLGKDEKNFSIVSQKICRALSGYLGEKGI